MQKIWNIQNIKEATGGEVNGTWCAGSIVIDSRSIGRGDLFLALRGEHTDGHNYINQAIKSGAAAVIIDYLPNDISLDINYCLVKDTRKALIDLAKYRRNLLKSKKIAVTGSVGKTSTKEMLKIAFEAIGKTYASYGNFNNNLGVPICLASTPDVDCAIYEIGMNHSGEITPLTKLVQPDIAIVTNVEPAHLEFFSSIEDIAHAKAEIFLGLNPYGYAILNKDNEWFDFLSNKAKELRIKNILSFGKKSDAIFTSYEEKADGKTYISADIMGEKLNYTLNFQANYIANTSLIALLCAKILGKDIKLAANNLNNFKLAKSRGEIFDLDFNGRSIKLIDDSYNASPASMKAALINLSNKKAKRKIAILADMREMGENSAYFHEELANYIGDIDKIITVGLFTKHLYAKLPNDIKLAHYEQIQDTIKNIDKYIEQGDTILIKGSFGTEIHKLAKYIKDNSKAI